MRDALKNCEFTQTVYDPKLGESQWAYALVKIDVWTKVNNKFIEVSNLVMLSFDGKDKQKGYLSFTRERDEKDPELTKKHLINSLKNEIATYYFNPLKKFQKPFKYAKRLFSLSVIYNDKVTAKKLVRLWKSSINILNQIRSELSVIEGIISKVPHKPFQYLFDQINNLKSTLVRITDIDIPPKLYDLIDQLTDSKSTEEMAKIFPEIEDMLSELINPLTVKYLKSVGLYPAPKKYLDESHYGYPI